jgi:STE24 endopeptidase
MISVNAILISFLSVYLFQVAFALWMEKLNHDHLKQQGGRVPPSFEGFIDTSKLQQITNYTLENDRVSILHAVISEVVFLVIILSGFLPFLVQLLAKWQLHTILAGLLFFFTLGLISAVLDLPFDYYHTFVIEEKYGFNRSTIKLWVMDHIKAALVSIFLFSILFSIILWMIDTFPNHWWLWSFLVVSGVQILLTHLYPVLIAPLFNKFSPLEDQELAQKIKEIMERGGIKIKGIFQMDAGRRSAHSNAYFTGFGKTKRIVLFDTLLQSHPYDEILAILAHEVGHFKRKHILKVMVSMEVLLLIGFYSAYCLMNWSPLYSTFGFDTVQPYVGLFFVAVLWQKIGFFLQPLSMALSRRFECQADRFAVQLSSAPQPLAIALKRMAADNLANLTPHPFYVWFHYSHPPLVQRVGILEGMAHEDGSFA